MDKPRDDAGLESYIKQALGGIEDPRSGLGRNIFDHGLCHRSPMLKRDRVNRILLFPGAFNPPHVIHQELLSQCSGKGGRVLNIIAAIIIPLDDEDVKDKLKLRNQEEKIKVFTKEQRAALWYGGVGKSDYYWVFDRSEVEFHRFKKCLTEAIVNDGFELKYVCAGGSEKLRLHEPNIPKPWDCDDLIVSDVGRPAEFTTGNPEVLRTLPGYHAWEKASVDLHEMKREAVEGASWIISGMFMHGPKSAQAMLDADPVKAERLVVELYDSFIDAGGAVAIRRGKLGNSQSTIHFIAADKKPSTEEISSTRIWQIIRGCGTREKLLEKLNGLALNPDILLRFLQY